MNFAIDLNTVLNGVVLLLAAAGVKGIVDLNQKVGAQNNRVGKLETWLEKHEKQDDLRHKESREDMAALWGKMDGE